MNIIDTNGINYIFANNLTLQDNYFLVPDVAEEVELTLLVHGRRLSNKVLEIVKHQLFDESVYLNHYNRILNKYGGRSFYNMTGFGDVSIIATLHMFVEIFEAQKAVQLFDPTEQIVVFTDDNGLATKIMAEFNSNNIHVVRVNTIK